MNSGMLSAPFRFARLMLVTRKVSSTSSRSARRQPGQGLDAAFALLAGDLQVEHGEERAQRVLEPGLLELRPALHVEGAVVVRNGRPARQHGGERLLRVRIVPGGEQQLAAAELGLVAEAVERVVLDQPVERLQRGVQVAALLVGPGELVEHAVVARVVGIGLEEVVVAGDRRLVVGRLAAGRALVVGQRPSRGRRSGASPRSAAARAARSRGTCGRRRSPAPRWPRPCDRARPSLGGRRGSSASARCRACPACRSRTSSTTPATPPRRAAAPCARGRRAQGLAAARSGSLLA